MHNENPLAWTMTPFQNIPLGLQTEWHTTHTQHTRALWRWRENISPAPKSPTPHVYRNNLLVNITQFFQSLHKVVGNIQCQFCVWCLWNMILSMIIYHIKMIYVISWKWFPWPMWPCNISLFDAISSFWQYVYVMVGWHLDHFRLVTCVSKIEIHLPSLWTEEKI